MVYIMNILYINCILMPNLTFDFYQSSLQIPCFICQPVQAQNGQIVISAL